VTIAIFTAYLYLGLPVESQVTIEARVQSGKGGREAVYEFSGLRTGRSDYLFRLLPPGYEWKNTPAPELKLDRWITGTPVTLRDLRGKVLLMAVGLDTGRLAMDSAIERIADENTDDKLVIIGCMCP